MLHICAGLRPRDSSHEWVTGAPSLRDILVRPFEIRSGVFPFSKTKKKKKKEKTEKNNNRREHRKAEKQQSTNERTNERKKERKRTEKKNRIEIANTIPPAKTCSNSIPIIHPHRLGLATEPTPRHSSSPSSTRVSPPHTHKKKKHIAPQH
jgi:hypothetical protein